MKSIHYQIKKPFGLRVTQLVTLLSIAVNYESVIYGKTEDIQVDMKSVQSIVDLTNTEDTWLMITINGRDEELAEKALLEFLDTLE